MLVMNKRVATVRKSLGLWLRPIVTLRGMSNMSQRQVMLVSSCVCLEISLVHLNMKAEVGFSSNAGGG